MIPNLNNTGAKIHYWEGKRNIWIQEHEQVHIWKCKAIRNKYWIDENQNPRKFGTTISETNSLLRSITRSSKNEVNFQLSYTWTLQDRWNIVAEDSNTFLRGRGRNLSESSAQHFDRLLHGSDTKGAEELDSDRGFAVLAIHARKRLHLEEAF